MKTAIQTQKISPQKKNVRFDTPERLNFVLEN